MRQLKTFAFWFGVGAGLIISGLFAVAAFRELKWDGEVGEFLILLALLAIFGGIFTGIFAQAIRRLIEPLPFINAALRREALMVYATQLGVSLQHIHDSNGHLLEVELQRRVLEMEKALRERRGYVVAVSAAVVSAVGACAAWLFH